MRISDWSSDVCSSDLITRGNGVATSYAWDPVSRLQTLTQNLGGTTNDLTLGFTYNPASQIAQATRRSAEHTSELHSLMRTSYAGFCLHTKRSNNSTASTKTDTSQNATP